MTPDEIEDLCGSSANWTELVDRLRPLSEQERALLSERVTAMTHVDHWNDYDGSAVAIAALGVLTDLHHLGLYGVRFQHPVIEAEPYLLQVLRDRRPRWIKRLYRQLYTGRWRMTRLAYAMARDGLVDRATPGDFPPGALFSLCARTLQGNRLPAQALRDEPELVDRFLWPMLAQEQTGRTLWHADVESPARFGKAGGVPSAWTDALLDQISIGGMERGRLLDVTLAAFLRGWPKVDQRWYVRFHEILDVTPEEKSERRETYALLLTSNYGPAVALGQAVLEELLDAGQLPVEDLLAASEPALLRAEKQVVLQQLRLLEKLAGACPNRSPEVAKTAATALQHPRTDVQERVLALIARLDPKAVDEARADNADVLNPSLRGPAATTARQAQPPTAPAEPGEVVPITDVDELVHVLTQVLTHPEPIEVERAYEGAVRLGRIVPDREQAALARRLDSRRQPQDHSLGLEPIVWSLGTNQPFEPPQVESSWDSARGWTRRPIAEGDWWLHLMVERRGAEVASHALDDVPTLLALPTRTDGSLRMDDLLERLQRGTPVLLPYDIDAAALRLDPGDHDRADELRGSKVGDRLANQICVLRRHEPQWRRVTWRNSLERCPGPPVWQDEPGIAGDPLDLVAAALDRRDMANRFGASHWGWEAVVPSAGSWPVLLPHHPELLAAHAHAAVITPLVEPWVTDPMPVTGSAPLLAALGASRTRTGPVTCSALGYGMSAQSHDDRTAAADAVIELTTHRLLDGAELGRQIAAQLAEPYVKGNRIAGALDEAARALGLQADPVLDALVEVLPALIRRRDAHLFADLTAQLAISLGRPVVLPPALAEQARRRSSSALVRALRRIPQE